MAAIGLALALGVDGLDAGVLGFEAVVVVFLIPEEGVFGVAVDLGVDFDIVVEGLDVAGFLAVVLAAATPAAIATVAAAAGKINSAGGLSTAGVRSSRGGAEGVSRVVAEGVGGGVALHNTSVGISLV